MQDADDINWLNQGQSWEVINFSSWKIFPSPLVWSLLSKPLICVLPYLFRTLGIPVQITYSGGSELESWAPRDDDVLPDAGEEMAFPGGCCINQKAGWWQRMSRKQSLYSEASASTLEILSDGPSITSFLPFRFLPLSHKNFLQDSNWWGGELHSGNDLCSGRRWFWVGLIICPWPSSSWIYPNQSKRLDLCLWLAQQLSLNPFPVDISSLCVQVADVLKCLLGMSAICS